MTAVLHALLLGAVFLCMVGSTSGGNLALAAGVGALAALAAALGREEPREARRERGAGRVLARAAALPWLAVGIALELGTGALGVLRLLAVHRGLPRLGTVEVPFGERSRRGAAVSALVASATPGTILLELDEERRVLVLTVADADEAPRVRRGADRFYRRFQRYVVP